MRVDRLARLPSTCDHPTPNTPVDNFEVFARTWAENYILFDQKKIDWDEIVRTNRGRVSSDAAPAQLFDLLVGMIEPFHDSHTSIYAPDLKRRFETMRPGTDRIIKGKVSEFRTKTMPALWAITPLPNRRFQIRAISNVPSMLWESRLT